jgi:site-specific DNA-methyltransferase (adenine-specific)
MNTDIIHTGDAFDVLPDLPDESIHACVTDPPYGLAFMGRDWDDFAPKEYQEWCERWAREVKRVLKPGAHLLAFSGNRTHHRLFSGVEDAGFEIRDTITWHYGSGFPKALDVSKAIDKAADAEREVVGRATDATGREVADGYDEESTDYGTVKRNAYETAPATDAAEKWDGFKTALKPATEYVVVARKPFDGTVAENVQTHGTGALNIDGTRVGSDADTARPTNGDDWRDGESNFKYAEDKTTGSNDGKGRYPSNVVFDEMEAERLDREVGELETGGGHKSDNNYGEGTAFNGDDVETPGYQGIGGPSRYFYTSKASKAERTLDGAIDNTHPTVKPADLMEWLVRLVTAEGQIVLDPFAGSGTTCRAAKDLGRRFVGIERQAKWADVARVRCGLTPDDPSVVRDDDAQSGVEDWA